MSKIHITADSTIDLSAELLKKFDIKTTPLHIFYGDEEYLDGVGFNSDDLLKKFDETGKLPGTSAVSVGEYTDFFTELTKDGDSVVHFSLSSAISSTHQNAVTASADMNGVFVIDTKLLSTAMALPAIRACEMRDKGYSAEEITRVTSELCEKVRCSFILERLDFMAKGGRCSGVVAFGANILGIKPGITMKDGKLGVGKKYRGKINNAQMQYLDDVLADSDDLDRSTAFITASPGLSEAQRDELMKEAKKEGKFENLYFTTAGCTITSHCGRNCVGLLVMKK